MKEVVEKTRKDIGDKKVAEEKAKKEVEDKKKEADKNTTTLGQVEIFDEI